jgi:integrase
MSQTNEACEYVFTPLGDCALHLPTVNEEEWDTDRPLSSHEVGRLLKRYARRAGLDPSRVQVRVLRLTAAALHSDAGAALGELSAMLGHTDLEVTRALLGRSRSKESRWLTIAEMLGL